MDESMCGKRKYHRGTTQGHRQKWVFGGICRLETLFNNTNKKLLLILKRDPRGLHGGLSTELEEDVSP